jgi:hypothetical protein
MKYEYTLPFFEETMGQTEGKSEKSWWRQENGESRKKQPGFLNKKGLNVDTLGR